MAHSATDLFATTEPGLLPILAELQAREPIFHQPGFASTLDDFASLMAPNYWEIGASGRRYSRAFILEHLTANQPISAEAAGWQASGFSCRQLGPATYLLTYTLQQGDRLTRRATLWQRTASAWQILYHQGTIVSGAHDDTPPETGYLLRSESEPKPESR